MSVWTEKYARVSGLFDVRGDHEIEECVRVNHEIEEVTTGWKSV